MRRIREVLETHDWAIDGGHTRQDDDLVERLLGLDEDHGDAERDYDDEGEEEDDGFKLEVNQLEREMLGLRMAIERGGGDGLDGFDDDENNAHRNDEVQVESLEALMMRMKAIRGMFYLLLEAFRIRGFDCNFRTDLILTAHRYECRIARKREEKICGQSCARHYARVINIMDVDDWPFQ